MATVRLHEFDMKPKVLGIELPQTMLTNCGHTIATVRRHLDCLFVYVIYEY